MNVRREDEVQLFEAFTLQEIRARAGAFNGQALNSIYLDSSYQEL